MEGLLPFAAALGLVALLEFGDKTQLATIALASRNPWLPVFAGSSAGLIAATSIGVVAGTVIATALSSWLLVVKVAAGAIFVVLGVRGLLHREDEDEVEPAPAPRGIFAQALTLNFFAEMGDKTQIAVIVLAASSAAPLSVFVGASAALVLIAASSVLIGSQLSRRLSRSRIELVASILFIAAGALLIFEALTGG
jgi:putative Ca2+/H+ antiporter (TMEM165/GDT1 family)